MRSGRRPALIPYLSALSLALVTSTAVPALAAPAKTAKVHPALAAAAKKETGKTLPVIAMLGKKADLGAVTGDHGAVVGELKRTAERTQRPVRDALPKGVKARKSLWIANALVLELPADGQAKALDSLARVPGIAELAPATDPSAKGLESPKPSSTPSPTPTAADADSADDEPPANPGPAVGGNAWGIDRIQANRVWDELGVTGAGTRVAVIDTGIDLRHPDLAGRLATDDPSDPTHPGGWISFKPDGTLVRSEPNDPFRSGTAISSLIAGGDGSGTALGAAPGAKLMHAQAFLPNGSSAGTTLPMVLAALQWAIEPTDWQGRPAGAPADVVAMMGSTGERHPFMIEATRAILAAGALPVFHVGTGTNACRADLATSPGDVFDAVAVGATDRSDTVSTRSCGTEIDRSDWRDGTPPDWPESYVKPDLTVPGVQVLAAYPGGDYVQYTGTEHAAAYVAGVATLVRSAVPGLPVADVKKALSYRGTRRSARRCGNHPSRGNSGAAVPARPASPSRRTRRHHG